MPNIDILMATYNGEKYLAAQIDSIMGQSFQNFQLFIRDDCSTDATPKIIKEFTKKFPSKIISLPAERNLGIIANFSALMEASESPYIMLSDQDDIWEKDKIEKTIAEMSALEKCHGSEIPLLVHTDLRVVDHNLQLIDPSFWRHMKLTPDSSHTVQKLILQNVVTGCSMLMNKKLLEMSLPIPKEAMMHDWWLALVAAAFGKISCVKTPTILYRQHNNNALGIRTRDKSFPIFSTIKKHFIQSTLHLLLKRKTINPEKLKQAACFVNRYDAFFSTQQKTTFKIYSKLPPKFVFTCRNLLKKIIC